MGREKERKLRVTLKKPCPHCDQPTEHEHEVVFPLQLNPVYEIMCHNCDGTILVSWVPDEHDREIRANFIKLPLTE